MNWSPNELKLINQYEDRSKEDPDIFYKVADQGLRTFSSVGKEISRICLAVAYLRKERVHISVIENHSRPENSFWILIIKNKVIAKVKDANFNLESLGKSYRIYFETYLENYYEIPSYITENLIFDIE